MWGRRLFLLVEEPSLSARVRFVRDLPSLRSAGNRIAARLLSLLHPGIESRGVDLVDMAWIWYTGLGEIGTAYTLAGG